MEFVDNLIANKVLLTAAVAWLTAGVIKVIIETIVYKKFDIRRVFGAGGMPSSHTATVVSLAISTGYYAGIDSTLFAVASILAIIVVHDAVGVRLETGKQAKVLNTMIFESSLFEDFNMKKLKEYVGHTPKQAFWGGVVGIIVTIIMINFVK